MLDVTKKSVLSKEQVQELIKKQRSFYRAEKCLSYESRILKLEKLKKAIEKYESKISEALRIDLNKSEFEAYVTETGFVLGELEHTQKRLRKWMKPKRVGSPWLQFPCASYIKHDPFGVTLIIGPWNYPFQLLISPLVGAIAAGNTAILKPSEMAPATSSVITEMIQSIFSSEEVAVVEGGIDQSTYLLDEKFDYIFYTGSTRVGQIVMEKASKYLTPVTLELGGKSPCLVFGNIDIDVVARRIVWGKFVNAGQTCVAPDYVLIEPRLKHALLEKIKTTIHQFYGENPMTSPDFCKIINPGHYNRLKGYLEGAKTLIGGNTNDEACKIEPTLIEADANSQVMKDEIFGPILPILETPTLDAAINFVNDRPKPLALYVFSKDKEIRDEVMERTSSGGVCLNDAIVHLSSPNLPFGGVGESGMGAYHGRASFDSFSHKKSIMQRWFVLDLMLRYPPYLGKLSIIKHLLKWLG